ncbi:MAG: hydroxymethylglutaryl-CoA synthase [Halobacteriales archaeon SW_8_66_22]|nr:MAG: hydroxymethylglutaryl-CoA synthase [Halobacteriales archaeon SW_8_66_22]
MTEVGIDGIGIWTGKLQLDLAETFAPAQGEDPGKYTKGLGLYASSLPDVYEDIVTMGANASHRLLERKDVSLEDIGRIDVATETSFDKSKPASTYVAGCLEQVFEGNLHHANKGERKFACVSGTQALDDAFNWVRAGRSRGRKALVIATDTALYERDDPGEATQGAGAVAMLIDENPDLVSFSDAQGFGSADETDFLKPNQQFPSVDGKRSMQVYLARMRESMQDFERNGGDTHPDNFALIPFHTPFPGMVRKAAALGFRHCIRGTEIEEELAAELGRQPRPEAFDDEDEFLEAQKEYTEKLTETDAYSEWYEETIEPTLSISRHVGNWYTGSVHIARAAGLIEAAETDRELAGRQLLVASYGSGAQAEIHAETVQPGWEEEIGQLNIFDQIEDRHDITFAEYEDIHDVHNHDETIELEPLTTPEGEFAFDGWGRMGERKYTYVE